MFSAPILRGYTLGALGKGSVTVPGSDHGVLSNIVDGAGIATASLSRSELGKHITDLDIAPGYIVTATLLSAITAHKRRGTIPEYLRKNRMRSFRKCPPSETGMAARSLYGIR